jgi:hypothetical protein
MNRPKVEDFGITQQDVEWASYVELRMTFALLLASMLGWGLYGLLTAKSFHFALFLGAIILGFVLVPVSAGWAIPDRSKNISCVVGANTERLLVFLVGNTVRGRIGSAVSSFRPTGRADVLLR